MARKIVFEEMVFMGVNTKEYRKDNIVKRADNAKIYDTTTDENHDYYIKAELAEELKKLPKMQPCKIYLNVSVYNGQPSLMLEKIDILKPGK